MNLKVRQTTDTLLHALPAAFFNAAGHLRHKHKRGLPFIARRRRTADADKLGAAAIGATALGALAVGTLAIGALAIGRLAIRRLVIGQSRFHSLELEELSVGRLQVGELVVIDSLTTPSTEAQP